MEKKNLTGISAGTRKALPPPPLPPLNTMGSTEADSASPEISPCLSPSVKPAVPSKPKVLFTGQKSVIAENNSNDPFTPVKHQTSVNKELKPPTPPKKPELATLHPPAVEKKSVGPEKTPGQTAVLLDDNMSASSNIDLNLDKKLSNNATALDPKSKPLFKKESFNLAVALKKAAERKLECEQNQPEKSGDRKDSPPKPPPLSSKPKLLGEKCDIITAKAEKKSNIDLNITSEELKQNGEKSGPPKPPPKVSKPKLDIPQVDSQVGGSKAHTTTETDESATAEIKPLSLNSVPKLDTNTETVELSEINASPPTSPVQKTFISKSTSNVAESKDKKKWWQRNSGNKAKKSNSVKESQKSNTLDKERRPSAKFYTNVEVPGEESITGESTFYRRSNTPDDSESSGQSALESENHDKNDLNKIISPSDSTADKPNNASSKPLPFGRKNHLVKNQYSSDSDAVNSPPLPRKTVNVRESVVVPSTSQSHTPVAPMRKKRTTKKKKVPTATLR